LIYFFERKKDTGIFPTYYKVNTHRKIPEVSDKTGFNIEQIKLVNTHAEFVMIPPIAFIELL
jgi:LysM repeat protein